MRWENNGTDNGKKDQDPDQDQEKREEQGNQSEGQAEIGYFNSQMQEAIRECIHSERDRLILTWREIDDLTHSEIREKLVERYGERGDRTEKQIGHIIRKHIKTLMWYCQEMAK